jgi:chemotaxis protein CheX
MMRLEYINPFVEAAVSILETVLSIPITRGEIFLKAKSQPVLGVSAIVGLAGDVEGRVLIDMSEETAMEIASIMNDEKITELSELAKATITEVANMIVAQAVTKLSDLGFKFDLTPPTIFTGRQMQISDFEVEALIVPIETKLGKLEINVALREKAGEQEG